MPHMRKSDKPSGSLPRHVGMIMDGNGRWASQKGMIRHLGHRSGMKRLEEMIRASSDWGIEALSMYAFSTENWNRPEEEVSGLFDLLVEFLRDKLDELHRNGVRFRILGEISSFPQRVIDAVDHAVRHTRENRGLIVSIALNYGSRDEILRAARALAERVERGELAAGGINQELLEAQLDSAPLPPLDCVIRTGGEKRLSNFLLYQAAYAELIFLDLYWPDFTRGEYRLALQEFEKRNRRFGRAQEPAPPGRRLW